MLIGLTGYKGSGKDTVADYLVNNHGFVKMSFAGLLKKSVCNLLDITPEQLEKWKNDDEVIITILGAQARLADGYRSFTFRQFLQRYGTEAHRDVFDSDFWINELADRWDRDGYKNVVIADTRFPNEADFIHTSDGIVIRIERGESTDEHVSESQLPSDVIDFWFYNEGTIEDLYTTIEDWLHDV